MRETEARDGVADAGGAAGYEGVGGGAEDGHFSLKEIGTSGKELRGVI